MKIIKDRDRRRALIGTIVFHSMLLIALIFMALITPLPLPGEEGVEVDLGYSDQGMGLIQPDEPVQEVATATPIPPQEVVEEVVEEEIVTTENEEVPQIEEIEQEEKPEEMIQEEEVVEPEPEAQPQEVPEPVKEEPKPVVNERALFKGTTGQNPQSEGITGQPGDQGKPDGLRDVKRYDGQGGKGDGPAFSLGGRGAKYLEKPTEQFKEQGDVVVDIWVNSHGIVKQAKVSPKGTTIIDPDLRSIAVRAALKSTFSEDPTAADLQKGTITYTFIIRR
ncbi:MAG: hypothetical protein PHG67_02765 [Bacteroidales bacterium]|jgi:outer membrane biosynthesis protein TonB|nr:hypothetical protein [Bacteroidales bacterium]